MKRLMFIVAAVAVVGLFAAAPQQAEARPQYLKGFVAKYDIAEAKEKKCGVCHGEGGKNKKTVSDYGKALGKALGKKNVKGADDITAALEAAEKGFEKYLKEGKLPPAAE